jgi:hypothetical protein
MNSTRRVIPARRVLVTQAFSGCTRTIGDSFQLPAPLDQHEWREQDAPGVQTPGGFFVFGMPEQLNDLPVKICTLTSISPDCFRTWNRERSRQCRKKKREGVAAYSGADQV